MAASLRAHPPSSWRLYVIVDRAASGNRNLGEIAAAAIRGGADVLQLRDKSASAKSLLETATLLRSVAQTGNVPFIVNDRIDVAMAVGADGVHLGQDDLPLEKARTIAGSSLLIGVSTHSIDQAMAAQEQGADYIGIGPVFPTPTKPDYESVGTLLVEAAAHRVRIPFVCIGGIDLGNVQQVMRAGGWCVAVVRAVCAAEPPDIATRDLKQAIAQFVPITARS